eukprot:jgi/Chrpa1/27568/Chrysochromulina_OHIO_Genome00025964-RA
MGQGVGRVWRPPAPRVERARPFSDEIWRSGLDNGTSIVFDQATRAAGAAAARVVEGVSAGVEGVEQGASMAAREAEGDDEDEAMVGDENVSMQMAEGGGGPTGGFVKKKCKRSRQKNRGQRQAMAKFDRRLAADDANVS